MRWLVTGATGLLGRELVARLSTTGESVLALDRAMLDITAEDRVRELLKSVRPHLVVNCAAWTAVDAIERDEPRATDVNGRAPGHLAQACATVGARLIQISTDYVFAGDRRTPYPEDAATEPVNAYGRSKLHGEDAVRSALPEAGYVLRTSWLYGSGGPSFVRTMAIRARGTGTVTVVADQHGQPTWTADLAAQIVQFGRAAAPAGTYHVTGGGSSTWYDLARETFRLCGADPDRVLPVTTEALRQPTPRPRYTVLGHDRWRDLGLPAPTPWQGALAKAVQSGAW